MTPTLLSLWTILTPLPHLSEPLTLTTGEVVTARYLGPSDEFCLTLEDFARVQSDMLHAQEYWEGRIQRLKLSFTQQLKEIQDANKQVHQAYLDENKLLKEELSKSYKERDLARSDLWWWRGATLGLTLSTTVTIIYLVSR